MATSPAWRDGVTKAGGWPGYVPREDQFPLDDQGRCAAFYAAKPGDDPKWVFDGFRIQTVIGHPFVYGWEALFSAEAEDVTNYVAYVKGKVKGWTQKVVDDAAAAKKLGLIGIIAKVLGIPKGAAVAIVIFVAYAVLLGFGLVASPRQLLGKD